jgi:hypothetical protein
MYTTQKTPLGRLRAYAAELAERYRVALERRDPAGARRILDLRRRVERTIRLAEEFGSVETALRVAATVTPVVRAPPRDHEVPAVVRQAVAIAAEAGL